MDGMRSISVFYFTTMMFAFFVVVCVSCSILM